MKNYFKLSLVVIAVLLVQCTIGAGNMIQKSQEITPDAEIQAQIERIVLILLGTHPSEEEALLEFAKIKQIIDSKRTDLILQLIYYRVETRRMGQEKEISSRETEDRMMSVYFFLKELIAMDENSERFSPLLARSIIDAVVPYLKTKDLLLQKELRWWLDKLDYGNGLKRDYSYYETYINENKKNPPEALIEYMYQKSPKETRSVLRRVYIEGGGTIPAFIQKVLNRTPEK